MSRPISPGRAHRHATALQYHEALPAPMVVAKGSGAAAERLIALAKSHGIAVIDGEPSAEALVTLKIGEFIPPELYEVVAHMLVFVRTMDRTRRP